MIFATSDGMFVIKMIMMIMMQRMIMTKEMVFELIVVVIYLECVFSNIKIFKRYRPSTVDHLLGWRASVGVLGKVT